jgi:molybdopterin molybdotransferase
MIPVHQAETIIQQSIVPLGAEWLDLIAAYGRVLAEGIDSPIDFPDQDTSSMDGYAVRHADLEQIPADLRVVETIPAGTVSQRVLQAGEAARLFTGSLLPPAADTVIMQEQTESLGDGRVRILHTATVGQFVRPQGQFCRQGDGVIPMGCTLQAAELAILAAVQRSTVQVYRQPQVAILSTGNELVRLDQPLQPGQIVDSNQYGLAALVRSAGGIPVRLGIVPDHPEILRARMTEALHIGDVVISSGGVSVGEFDYVEQLLRDLGGEVRITSVAIRPGKPFTFAVFPQPSGSAKLYFGLPGNPVSALVTFWRLVQPALAQLQGQPPPWGPAKIWAATHTPLRSEGKRETYLWGKVLLSGSKPQFIPVPDHHSGNLISLAGCNGLAILPQGIKEIAAGEQVQILLTGFST